MSCNRARPCLTSPAKSLSFIRLMRSPMLHRRSRGAVHNHRLSACTNAPGTSRAVACAVWTAHATSNTRPKAFMLELLVCIFSVWLSSCVCADYARCSRSHSPLCCWTPRSEAAGRVQQLQAHSPHTWDGPLNLILSPALHVTIASETIVLLDSLLDSLSCDRC